MLGLILTESPLVGYMIVRSFLSKALAAVRAQKSENVYRRIGVTPLINGRGTWTYISGSIEWPEVTAARQEAVRHFVDMIELQRAVSARLAELSGAEAGMVTSGAAGALAAATAACIAGTDPAKIWQLPDTTGLKHEVPLFGGRFPFDSAIRLAGGKVIPVATHDELCAAINENTAMICTTVLGEDLERVLATAKKTSVPLLLDDAAGIPPFDNIRAYARMGVDLYTFSGGKGLRGPQSSGLLLGRRDLITAALANSCPWEGAVCRAMKVGKEEIIGCLAAVEVWSKMDAKALSEEWNSRVQRIARIVETVPGVRTCILIPQLANRYPSLDVSWDAHEWHFTPEDCYRELRDGDPRIEVLIANNPVLLPGITYDDFKTLPTPNTIRIVSTTLRPGEEWTVAGRLREVLSKAAKCRRYGLALRSANMD